MVKSIMIDPGHGGTDPGARAFGVQEKDWNLRISLYQYERLKELGAKVGITRTSDVTLDSVPRTNKIRNKYDVCISNHWNAFNGSARGIETIHSIFGGKSFATNIANALVKATGIPLRRVFSKRNNSGTDWYFMHRLTGNTRTVIIEYGFLDNSTDHNWYKDNSNFIKAAEAVIEAVCKEIGITYKSPSGKVSKPSVPQPSVTGTLYKVQAGAFSKKENAEALHERMQKEGIDAFVLKEGNLYKVQAGAYSNKKNAEQQLKKVTKLVGDGFIVETGTAKSAPQPVAKPKPQPTKQANTGGSIVDYLNSNKINSSFANRKKLAREYLGISNYTGTAKQNTDLLNAMRSGKKPAQPKATSNNVSNYRGSSIVDYLNLSGNKHLGGSSFNNRKKLAEANGIRGYTGTAAQNKQLLLKLQGGSVATPTRSVNVNAIAEQIKKGIDSQGRHIPIGHEPRRKHFGLTKDEYAKVRTRVNQIM